MLFCQTSAQHRHGPTTTAPVRTKGGLRPVSGAGTTSQTLSAFTAKKRLTSSTNCCRFTQNITGLALVGLLVECGPGRTQMRQCQKLFRTGLKGSQMTFRIRTVWRFTSREIKTRPGGTTRSVILGREQFVTLVSYSRFTLTYTRNDSFGT